MSANLMYSPLETTFEATMQREGTTLTTYTSKDEFQAFFRIRNDNENQRETVVIYYGVNAPVRSGTLVEIGNDVFIALNRETVENDVYYKSTMVKCNGIYTNNDDYKIGNIPFYTDTIKSTIAVGNDVLAMLNGNLELITEDNSLSRQIKINSTFNEFNRTFKVCNIFCIDGITHVVAEVYADLTPSVEYSIVIDGYPTGEIYPGDTFQLFVTGCENGKRVSNATFDWKSNNTEVATIAGNGVVTVKKAGTVSFIATWVEKDKSQRSDEIIISSSGEVGTRTITITYGESAEVVVGGGYKRFSVTITDSEVEKPDLNLVEWTVTILPEHEKYITYEVQDDHSIMIKTTYSNKILGETILLTATYCDVKDSVYVRLCGLF